MLGPSDAIAIDALDWLTLSFSPPSLIAPLITAQAQVSYQRVLNFLLRIERVKTVLRGLYVRVFKLRYQKGVGRRLGGQHTKLEDPLENALTLFHGRAQHFVSQLASYLEQVVLGELWGSFQARLEQLQRHVEREDDLVLLHADEDENEEELMLEEGDLDTVGHTTNISSDPTNLSGRVRKSSQAHGYGRGEGQGGYPSSLEAVHELKDVFSIARYHERVLDRMVGCLFQKTSQASVGKMMDDLFQLILDLSDTLRTHQRRSPSGNPGKSLVHDTGQPETLSDAESGDEREELLIAQARALLARFDQRFSTLVQALHIVELSGPRAKVHAVSRGAGRFGVEQAPAGTSRSAAARGGGKLDPETEAELARQNQEAEQDLRLLEIESRSYRGRSLEAGWAGILVTRLDLMRRYVRE